jgi:uncharacterized protein
MNAAQNKQLMQTLFAELAKGNGRPFVDSLSEDFCWTITGTTPWSRTYEGKQAVLEDLLAPLFSRFASQYTNTAHNFIAEGDQVVVECRGKVMTKKGVPYNNTYCYVCRLANGKLIRLTEYLDTALVNAALDSPAE